MFQFPFLSFPFSSSLFSCWIHWKITARNVKFSMLLIWGHNSYGLLYPVYLTWSHRKLLSSKSCFQILDFPFLWFVRLNRKNQAKRSWMTQRLFAPAIKNIRPGRQWTCEVSCRNYLAIATKSFWELTDEKVDSWHLGYSSYHPSHSSTPKQ